MEIIIVGSGLIGLSAAICFTKHGHDVTVLERKDSLSVQGGGISIRPGASRILHTWGLRQHLETICSVTPTSLLRSAGTGKIAQRNILVDVSEHPEWGTTRTALISILYDYAQASGARIRFGATVANVREDGRKAYVILEDGSEQQADVVLAADGIRSRIRDMILSDYPKSRLDPQVSEWTSYIVKVSNEELSKHSEGWLVQQADQSNINVWMGRDMFAVSRYHSQLRQYNCSYIIRGETDQRPLWDEDGDIDLMRKWWTGTCRDLAMPLEIASRCERWKFAELPDLPRWTSKGGRIVLLGDSAHAMMPSAAQGFSQGVEDVGVLDYLISQDQQASWNVKQITSKWEQLRKERAERIKAWAAWNTKMSGGGEPAVPISGEGKIKSAKHVVGDMRASFHSSRFVKWALDFDAVGEARRHVEGERAQL